jgi:fructoselysine-6-P-deglycase FrlB-like protein
MEFRHGPVSIADEHSVVWVFGEPPAGLLDELDRTGALVVNDNLDAAADLIRAQRLGVALATVRGLDPDQPRNLTRSVILH